MIEDLGFTFEDEPLLDDSNTSDTIDDSATSPSLPLSGITISHQIRPNSAITFHKRLRYIKFYLTLSDTAIINHGRGTDAEDMVQTLFPN